MAHGCHGHHTTCSRRHFCSKDGFNISCCMGSSNLIEENLSSFVAVSSPESLLRTTGGGCCLDVVVYQVSQQNPELKRLTKIVLPYFRRANEGGVRYFRCFTGSDRF